MAGTKPNEPGERGPATRPSRELERPPGERYARADTPPAAGGGSELTTPFLKAVTAAAIGALLLFLVGGLMASTAGLLLVAGITGAAVGLLLARAAVTGPASPPGGAALTRRQASRLAIAIAILAVIIGALATWLFARAEGGTLGFLDYLTETFGLFTPAELLVAALAAAWGAGAGPVER